MLSVVTLPVNSALSRTELGPPVFDSVKRVEVHDGLKEGEVAHMAQANVTIVFHNDWFLHCFQTPSAPLLQVRFSVQGSDAGDGVYSADVEQIIDRISGTEWYISIEWLDESSDPPVWRSEPILATSTLTLAQGLVTSLVSTRSQTSIQLTSLEPAFQPRTNPYTFTIAPENVLQS